MITSGFKNLGAFFGARSKTSSADTAKERLQILLQHERASCMDDGLLMRLRADILKVLERYVQIDPGHLNISLGKEDKMSTLAIEIEITAATLKAA